MIDSLVVVVKSLSNMPNLKHRDWYLLHVAVSYAHKHDAAMY